jgi:hypothetical protein
MATVTLNRVLLAAVVVLATTFANAQTVPNDAKATCTVTAPVFASWFHSGAVTLNGVVDPANSVTFPDVPNCSFYQWSKQMFLWATSPAPVTYGGGGGRIFDSPAFFDVSPPDGMGHRTFIRHAAGVNRIFTVRVAQVGPHGLPIIFDKQRRMIEVERPQIAPTGKQLIRDRTGNLTEIDRVALGANKKLVLTDRAGKTIQPLFATAARPLTTAIASNLATRVITAQKFFINGNPIFVDPFGNVIDVEQGQADGGVLETQNGSLIYYATIVNDVYAYFLTGTKNGGITPAPTQFPTTQADLNKITAFATAHGKTFPDPNALAIEIKSSWVEAAGLPNLNTYITMTATVPTYDKTNPNQWVPNGQKTVQLALVGMHVVGSTKGHPEMIWSTFEHFNNAPNGAYSYINTLNQTKSVAQNTAGTWLFTANNSAGPFNVMHMQEPFGTNNIVPIAPHTISASDTIRWKAFGGASNVSPNPLDPTTAASNTEIISIHNSVDGMLINGDVRKNYVMTGATWTIFGASPTSTNQVGTSLLANTTMETYQQGHDTTKTGDSSNCFTCHPTNTTGVSHVFAGLKALF